MAGVVDWPGLSDIAGIQRRGDGFAVSRRRLRSAEHIGGTTMFASSNEPHNWGVWLLCVLPAVMRFMDNRPAYDRLLIHADHPNMRAMLRLLGFKAADVILHDCSRAYHFESIVVLGEGGLFNAVFCKPGTRIVDIESTRDHLENHSTVLSSMDADYGIILGRVD